MKSIKAILLALTLLFFSRVYAADDAHASTNKWHDAKAAASCCAAITADTTPQEEPRQTASAQDKDFEAQTFTVNVTEKGYEPVSLKLRKEIPAKVTFVRQTEKTCGLKLVIPEYGIKRDLPLNEAVVVAFTPNKSGEFTFTCGMGMLRGSIVVQ